MIKQKKYSKRIDVSLKLWVKLSRAFLTFNKLVSNNIRMSGLTEPQFGVIECLGHLGTMKIGDLTKKHLVSGGNMTVIIDNLEKENIVERTRSDDNRRVIYVGLTPKGKKLFTQIFMKHAEYIAQLASVLSEKEQIELARLLKKLGLSLKDFS